MKRHPFVSTALVAAVAALALPAAAAEGLKVTRDPTTGQLRAPTPEESAALDAASSGSKASQKRGSAAATGSTVKRGMVSGKANPQQVRHADGSVGLELDESTMSYSVVRRNADGTLSNYCVTGEKAAHRIVRGGKAPAGQTKGGQLELQ